MPAGKRYPPGDGDNVSFWQRCDAFDREFSPCGQECEVPPHHQMPYVSVIAVRQVVVDRALDNRYVERTYIRTCESCGKTWETIPYVRSNTKRVMELRSRVK